VPIIELSDPNGFIASPAIDVCAIPMPNQQCHQITDFEASILLPSGNANYGGRLYNAEGENRSCGTNQATSVSLPNAIYSAPARIQDVIFFGSTDHNIYAYAVPSMKRMWTWTTAGKVNSGPGISSINNVTRIYVGSDDGYIRCFSINGL
jgi:outer membrane protein assembly factor BamB